MSTLARVTSAPIMLPPVSSVAGRHLFFLNAPVVFLGTQCPPPPRAAYRSYNRIPLIYTMVLYIYLRCYMRHISGCAKDWILYVTPGKLAENSMAVLSLPPATAINILLCYTMFSYTVLISKINYSILFYSILYPTYPSPSHFLLLYISLAPHILLHIINPTFPFIYCQLPFILHISSAPQSIRHHQPHISFFLSSAPLSFYLLVASHSLLHIIFTITSSTCR
jgi:hypothetical protein